MKGSHRVKPRDNGCEHQSDSLAGQVVPRERSSFHETMENAPALNHAMTRTKSRQRCLLPRQVLSPDLMRIQMYSLFLNDAVPLNTPKSTPRPMHLWLSSIPDHFGKNEALDDALCCLVMHHTGCVTSQIGLTLDGREAYGKALKSLQRAINTPSERDPSAIVCATSILSVYEVSS